MCFVFIWEQTATCANYSINWLVFITEMKSVCSAVRTGSLNTAVCASALKGYIKPSNYIYISPWPLLYIYETRSFCTPKGLISEPLCSRVYLCFTSSFYFHFSTPLHYLLTCLFRSCILLGDIKQSYNNAAIETPHYVTGNETFFQGRCVDRTAVRSTCVWGVWHLPLFICTRQWGYVACMICVMWKRGPDGNRDAFQFRDRDGGFAKSHLFPALTWPNVLHFETFYITFI